MKITDVVFSTFAVAGVVWLLSQTSIIISDYPSYSFNEEHAKKIYYKYDLKNNSNPECNDVGCASINPIMATAWKELCSIDGNCSDHDAFHFWYSNNIEVEKTKKLWVELSK